VHQGFSPGVFPYLWASPKKDATIPKGTPAVYTGRIRVEETGRNGTIRVSRHTFIIGGIRYIANDLIAFRPTT
jgi:hypothetical protein